MATAWLAGTLTVSHLHDVPVLLRVDGRRLAPDRCESCRSSTSARRIASHGHQTRSATTTDAIARRSRPADVHDFDGIVQCAVTLWRRRARFDTRNLHCETAWRSDDGGH